MVNKISSGKPNGYQVASPAKKPGEVQKKRRTFSIGYSVSSPPKEPGKN